MLKITSLAVCCAFFAAGSLVHAGTIGQNVSPLGSRSDSGVQFALWDIFSQTLVPSTTTYTFSGIADVGSTLTNLSLTQNLAHALGVQGSGLLLDGDAYYSSTFAQNWTLSATASIDVTAIAFQIKTANVNLSVLDQIFTPTLNGIGAATFISGLPSGDAPISGSFVNYVLEYRWTDLDISAGSAIDISFAMAGGSSGNFTRKPVDFVSLDVATVPEPSSAILCAAAGAFLLARRGRRNGQTA